MAEKEKKEENWWQAPLVLFSKLSVYVAGQVVVATFIGKWLDEKYQTEPWLLLACVGLAFVISMAVLVKTAEEEFKKINNQDTITKKQTNSNNQ